MSDLGRPPTYKTEAELTSAIEAYFEYIKGEKQSSVGEGGLLVEVWTRNPEPATITGLAYHLGFESRQSVYDYEKKGEFSYSIKRARLRVEHEYEKKLSGNNCVGAIFALKNFDWKDKVDTELSGRLNLSQITGMEFKDDEVKV